MTILFLLLALLVLVVGGLLVRTWNISRTAPQLVPQAGEIRTVTGGALHYIERGPKDAQPLVLIHGLSGQLQHFTYALTDRLSDSYRVIAVDRPGCGYSSRDGDARAALEEQARMIWDLLDQLGVTNPVLVGHSLGGAVSLAMALERPAQTGALALIAPLTHPVDTPAEAFAGLAVASPLLRRVLAHTLAVPMAQRTAADVLAMVFHPEPAPDDFLIKGGGALGLRSKSYITASADFVGADAGIRRLAPRYAAELKTPGGVLYGSEDVILSATQHGETMTRYGLSYEALPDRGHMIPLTDPDSCERFIRKIAQML